MMKKPMNILSAWAAAVLLLGPAVPAFAASSGDPRDFSWSSVLVVAIVVAILLACLKIYARLKK